MLPLDEPVIIDRFEGEYAFLSNFYIEPDGTHVEGEYQAHKTIPISKDLLTLTPGQAKRKGQRVLLRPDWDAIKTSIMYFYIVKKFKDHKDLREKLLNTGNAVLIEGNDWGDTFWGQVNGKGENMLGKTLMIVRDLFRDVKSAV